MDLKQVTEVRKKYKIPDHYYLAAINNRYVYFVFQDSDIEVDIFTEKATESHMALGNDGHAFRTQPWPPGAT